MRFCVPHWKELREAIKSRGLDAFVAADGTEAVRRMANGISSGASKRENFDPLMGAHNLIIAAALEKFGLELLAREDDPCPICGVQKAHDDQCEAGCGWKCEWIEGAADDMSQEAIRLGLVGAS